MIPKTKGYTEIVKITEAALNGDKEKAKLYIEQYISEYPDSDLIKPFTHLLNGELNPDGLGFHEITETDTNDYDFRDDLPKRKTYPKLNQQPSQSDMDIVAKFPEQKTIKAKLVYEKPEQEVSATDVLNEYGCHPIPYNEQITMAYVSIIEAMEHYASLREVKIPDRKDYSTDFDTHLYNGGWNDCLSEIKRLNNLK